MRVLMSRWTWAGMAVTSCGLLSGAADGDDAGDGAQGVEAETPALDAPVPDASEPEAPEAEESGPSAVSEPDAPSGEQQTQPAVTSDTPEPDPANPAQGGASGIGEGVAGSSASGSGAAGAPQEQPSPAEGGASSSEAGGSGGVAGSGAGAGGTAGSSTVISFAKVEADVFEPARCGNDYCHGASAGNLTWSYAELVGAAATAPACGLTERVVPGDPEASLLWQRVRPTEGDEGEACGEKMPKGGAPLSAEQAQLVYDWIASGAAP